MGWAEWVWSCKEGGREGGGGVCGRRGGMRVSSERGGDAQEQQIDQMGTKMHQQMQTRRARTPNHALDDCLQMEHHSMPHLVPLQAF